MIDRLPILTHCFLLAVAAFVAVDTVQAQTPASSQQPAAEAPAESTPAAPLGEEQASQIVRSSLETLETLRSVSAQMRFSGRVLGFEVRGKGVFAQAPIDDYRYRFELQMRIVDPIQREVEDQTSILLHVCDGKYLWMHQQLPDQDQPSVTKVEVAAAYFGLASRRRADGFGMFPRTPALGGLARTLRELDAAFRFVEVRETQLGKLDVWAVQGQWDTKHLAKISPGMRIASLPKQLPTYVVLYIGRDDSFPYRFDYYRHDGAGAAKEPMMSLEMFHVQLNGPLDAKQFTYQPGDLPVQDGTVALQLKLDVSPIE